MFVFCTLQCKMKMHISNVLGLLGYVLLFLEVEYIHSTKEHYVFIVQTSLPITFNSHKSCRH